MKNKGANTLEAITLEDNQHPNKYYTFASESKDGGIEDGHIPEVYKSYIESVGSVNKLIKEHNAIIVPKRESFEKDTAIEIRIVRYTLITGLELSLLQHKMKTVGE